MSDNLHVPKEFLVQEEKEQQRQQLGQTMPKSKKTGGPYPIHTKKLRRDKVLHLHFDYGYSARKIADIMKINRNTINSDISYWYSQFQKEDDKVSANDWINKILYRFETKRVRLMEKLDKPIALHDFMLLEKMIFEIDTKIIQVAMKIHESNQSMYDITTKIFNKWLEEHGYKERYVLWGQTLRVTQDTSKKIKKIIQSDTYQKPVKAQLHNSNITNSKATSQCKF